MYRIVLKNIKEELRRIRFNRTAEKVNLARGPDKVETVVQDEFFELAAVVMIRGEKSYIKEWIEFHMLMGVSHFYIYDNDLEEDMASELSAYIEAGVATVIDWQDQELLRDKERKLDLLSLQQLAIGHCVQHYRHHYSWVANFDIDEYIFPKTLDCDSIIDVLRSLDKNSITEIEIERTDFGSNGHIKRPKGPVIQSYTKCVSENYGAAKCIANSDYLSKDLFFYAFRFQVPLFKKVRFWITQGPQRLQKAQAKKLLVLNHYHVKSKEEFLEKGSLYDQAGYMVGKNTEHRFNLLDSDSNLVENEDILRFLPKLGERWTPIIA